MYGIENSIGSEYVAQLRAIQDKACEVGKLEAIAAAIRQVKSGQGVREVAPTSVSRHDRDTMRVIHPWRDMAIKLFVCTRCRDDLGIWGRKRCCRCGGLIRRMDAGRL